MRAALPLLGVLMVLIGGVWALQGFNVLPGSPMTGVAFWAVAGSVLAIAGVALIVYWARGRRP